MFNWFKRKIELKDEKSIMSSIHNSKGLKLGSEITIPSNFECLVYNNGRYYFSLPDGKYKVSKDGNFSPLYIAQQKNNRKSKYIKCVCHYINKSPQNIKIKYKKQKYSIDYTITDLNKFTELMLLYTFKVNNDYAQTTIYELFYELLSWHKGDHKQITKTSLQNYGLEISSFSQIKNDKKSSIFDTAENDTKSSIFNIASTSTTNESILEQEVEQTIQPNPITDTQLSQSTETSQSNNCPRCGNVSKFSTTYCLKCGYKLE